MAQVNWNRQLGLAVGLFVLGTTAYWLEYKHKPEKESFDEQSKRIFPLKDTPAESITLSSGSKKYVLTCSDLSSKLCKSGDNSKWEVAEPMKLKADDSNVNALLSTLSTLNSGETIDLKTETAEKKAALLKEYGLDPDSRKSAKRVHVVTPSGETVLYLGQQHPIDENFFALEEHVSKGQKPTGAVDENRVYMVPNFFKVNFDHDLTYWREKKLLTLASHEVESFQFQGPKGKFSAEKKGGQWLLHSTVGQDELPGDTENVDGLLSTATFLSAKNFTSDSKSDAKAKAALAGLTKALTLTLQKEKGSAKEAPTPVTVSFFRKGTDSKGKLYATVSNLDPLFELEPNSIDRLDKSLKDLRMAKLVTSMERFSAKRLEFSGASLGATPLILTNADGKWMTPDKVEASNEKVQSTLDKISGNRIKEFFEGKAIPSGEKDGLKFTLGDDKTEAKRQLLFWKKDDKLFARDLQSKRNEAFLVDGSVKDSLPWDRDFYKKSDLKDAPKSVTPSK